jgi:hypothetical protein
VDGLRISEDLVIPLAVVTEKLAILAQSGAGKSYLAMRLAELMLRAGAQVVALDPVGTWWGLRAGADGSPSGLPIVVFGGEHGDLPLDPTAGAALADVIVDLGISAALDLSDLEMPDQKRFTAAFAERFFRRKKRAKSPVHLFLEEAQVAAPQFPERDETVMLNRIERLCRIGRNYGVGWTIVSQRPQEVHKKVLNQAGTLFALRTVGRHERKAVADWVADKATAADARRIDALPSLETGTAQVWSPAFLRVATTIQVSRRETFDSSRTPEVGEAAPEAALSPPDIDLDAIRAGLEAAASGPDATDERPARDQKRAIAEQGRLLAEREERIAVLEGVIRDLRARPDHGDLVALLDRAERAIVAGESAAMRTIDAVGELRAELARHRPTPVAPSVRSLTAGADVSGRSGSARSVKASAPPKVGAKTDLSAPQTRILEALASFRALGIDAVARSNVAVFAGASPTSSGFANNLGWLRTRGLVDYPAGGAVAITEAGLACVGEARPIRSLAELHEAWCAKLTRPQAAIVQALCDTYPLDIERVRLAGLVGQSATSSGYANNLGALRSLGLIDYPSRGRVAATSLLFPEGLR